MNSSAYPCHDRHPCPLTLHPPHARFLLVMKRYECNLESRIRNSMDMVEVRRVVHSLFQTLAELHSAGVIVRDIKPDNILFDEYSRPHFADFGISTVVSRTTRYAPTSVKGAYNYMAPEAFEENGIGVEVDVWSMACVVVEMCTGEMPWCALRMQQITRAVCDHRRIPDVPHDAPMAELVRQCFAFNPADRPTAAEMAAALEPARIPEATDEMHDKLTRALEKLATVGAERDQQRARAEAAEAEVDRLRMLLRAVGSVGVVSAAPAAEAAAPSELAPTQEYAGLLTVEMCTQIAEGAMEKAKFTGIQHHIKNLTSALRLPSCRLAVLEYVLNDCLGEFFNGHHLDQFPPPYSIFQLSPSQYYLTSHLLPRPSNSVPPLVEVRPVPPSTSISSSTYVLLSCDACI